VGFNSVLNTLDSKLFKNLAPESEFYFTHSFKMSFENLGGVKAITNYSVDFLSAYENENVFATQFHPEKSQTNGLQLLWNFLEA
jgi:glutamine amidotransferase